VSNVGVPLQEPQKLVDDGAEMDFLGGHQRESLFQVEAHLMAEHRKGAGAGSVFLLHTFLQHPPHEIMVLVHPSSVLTVKDHPTLGDEDGQRPTVAKKMTFSLVAGAL